MTHTIWPSLAIDQTTLILVIAAALPWLAPLFKAVEFPGGFKVELQEFKEAERKADSVGLLAAPEAPEAKPEYSFQLIQDDDPNLALAGLRIEIEKRLVSLADSFGIRAERQSITRLMRSLRDRDGLSGLEYRALADIVGLLNSAVHGAKVDPEAYNWAMDFGPRLVKSLDDRIQQSAHGGANATS